MNHLYLETPAPQQISQIERSKPLCLTAASWCQFVWGPGWLEVISVENDHKSLLQLQAFVGVSSSPGKDLPFILGQSGLTNIKHFNMIIIFL